MEEEVIMEAPELGGPSTLQDRPYSRKAGRTAREAIKWIRKVPGR